MSGYACQYCYAIAPRLRNDLCPACDSLDEVARDLQAIADRLAALPGSERVRGEGLRLASEARRIACAVEVLAVVMEDEARERR